MKAVVSSVTMAMRHGWRLGEVCRVSTMGQTVSDVIQDVYLLSDVTKALTNPQHSAFGVVCTDACHHIF